MQTSRLLLPVVCALSAQLSGCSWVFVQKAPPGPVEAFPASACTSSAAGPIADTVLASLFAGGGLALIIGAVGTPHQSDPYAATVSTAYRAVVAASGAILAGGSIPWAFSAAYGYTHTADCRELRQNQAACLSGVEDSCRWLKHRTP